MDPYRFYVPDLISQLANLPSAPHRTANPVLLPDDQAHHARAVLRLEPGDRVLLFDGRGAWAHGTIAGEPGARLKNRGDLPVLVSDGIHVDPPPALHLTLATAVPKGDRAEWLVEQASQLNVGLLQWLDCDRGVVKPREGGQKIDKWRRLAIESAKQCARTHIMHVEEPLPIDALIGGAQPDGDCKILWLEPRAEGGSLRVADALRGLTAGRVLALVGPEGGWSERECQILDSAATAGQLTRVQLTQTVLRIETACAAIASIVMSA